MFDLLKKIVNYFTPLDEEAEVEKAAEAASIVKSDDECLATRTNLDKNLNNKPALPATAELPKKSAIRESSEPSKATAVPETPEAVQFQPPRNYPKHAQPHPYPSIAFSHPQSNLVQADSTRKKRAYRSLNPGEGKFKVDVGPAVLKTPDNPAATSTSTSNSRKGKKQYESGYLTYDMNGNPLFLSSLITTETTTLRSTSNVPELNGTTTAAMTSKGKLVSPGSQGPTAATRKSATTEAKGKAIPERRGRPPGSKNKNKNKEQLTATKTKSELGKRKEKESKTKNTIAESTPTPTKKQRRVRKDYSENHTTRGRSRKLGDHQCLICGETFFDLKDRDSHAAKVHPRTTKWKH